MKSQVHYIEDEEDYQILVKKILGRGGCTVTTSDTAGAGLAALEARNPDVLLLDINLPDANGYTLCEAIRKTVWGKDLPILMLTVRRRPDEWLQGFSVGADDYLSKPFNPQELVTRVEACALGQSRRLLGNGTPEHQLIQAAVGGNRAAFEVLIRQYQGRLAGSMASLGYSIHEAEEIAAQAFVYAYEHLHTFRGGCAFYTWLYSLARTAARVVRRKTGVVSIEPFMAHSEKTQPEALLVEEPSFEDVAEETLVPHLPAVVRDVPQPYRKMLEMHVVKGWPYRRIARKMNVPQGTVMSRLSRARQLLREAWEKRVEER